MTGSPLSVSPSVLLHAERVSKHFPGVQALRNIDFTLDRGEVHALVGQNGAGKSTLVKCISGVHPPDGGRITFDGREVTAYSPKHAYDLGIAVVHQRPQLLPWLSVTENVIDRKSTRLNSSHLGISYAVFCLKKKKIIS